MPSGRHPLDLFLQEIWRRVNIDKQASIEKLLKHYFGSTIEPKSQQPLNPLLQKSVDEVCQMLKKLHHEYPTATHLEARQIIEVEFEEIQASKPAKWGMFQKQLLHPECWQGDGKAALLAAIERAIGESIFGSACIDFLESFSKETKN